jgi:capsular exopolysaccharide synthesis family protein
VTKKGLLSLEGLQRENELRRAINSVVKQLVGQRSEGTPEDALAKSIVGSLKVSTDIAKPGAASSREVLNVSFQGKDVHDCNAVLSAIIAVYQEFLKDTYRNVNAETLDLIARARDVSQKEHAAKEAAYREFRRATPLLWKGKDANGTTVYQDRLFNIDGKQLALRMRQAEIKGSLSAIENALKEGRSYAELLDLVAGPPSTRDLFSPTQIAIAAPSADPPNQGRGIRETLEEQLVNLQLEERKLVNHGFGEAHPQVQAVRDRMENVRGLFSSSLAKEGNRPDQKAWIEGFVKLKVQLLNQEFSENERSEKSLAALFDVAQSDAKGATLHEIEDESQRAGIERSKLLYEGIVKRLQEIDSVKDYGGYDTQILAAPEGRLAQRKYLLVFPGAMLLGLLAGFAWGSLAELKDKSFRTAGEVRRLGLPVLGQIPFFRPTPRAALKGSTVDPTVCTYHRPASVEAEAYRGVRTVLYFARGAETLNGGGSGYIFNDGLHLARSADAQNVLQITSPSPGDGKSTLAANLAVSIAQSGKKVLLIDADFRRPKLHALFGLDNKMGLASLLASQTIPAAKAIQQTGIVGLSMLPSGVLPANPADLLTSPRLKEVLESLRREYDFVLIDTPPVLAVTDPCAVAPQVRGVLLTIRNSKNARPDADEARERLENLGANVLGVVVNCTRDLAGASSYGYGRYLSQPVG